MAEKIIEKCALWYKNFIANKEVVINCGGSSSGKTYCILDMLMYKLITEKNIVISVVGQNYPNLKRGACRDCYNIWNNDSLYRKLISEPNQNGCKCELTGSIMEFVAYQSAENAKSGKRTYSFFNEVSGIPYEIFFEIQLRTKKQTWCDFNPTSRFWIYDKYQDNEKAQWIYSTHKANKFLPQKIHDDLENLKFTDENRWRVYCLGELGKVEGLVYNDWSIVDVIPDNVSKRVIGLDFGFKNDPTAIVDIRYVDGQIWCKEVCYKTGLTNFEIADILKRMNLPTDCKVVCDSAEQKSIEELKRLGIFQAVPCVKGKGSIQAGVSLVQSYHLNVERKSINLQSELLSYEYSKDSLGHYTNQPDDGKPDHACFVGDTLITTQRGLVPIKDIKPGKDFALTSNGFKKIINLYNNGIKSVSNFSILIHNDTQYKTINLTATPNHKVKTLKNDSIVWKELQTLSKKDVITSYLMDESMLKKNQVIGAIYALLKTGFIKLYGFTTTEKYQKDIIFTTKTMTKTITTLKTLNALMQKNICRGITKKRCKTKNMLKKRKKGFCMQVNLQNCGMPLKKVINGMLNTEKMRGKIKNTKNINVLHVEKHSCQEFKDVFQNTVPTIVKTMDQQQCKKEFVNAAEKNLKLENVLNEQNASIVKVVEKTNIPNENVYDLEVEDEHEYFANGLLVHNCDALRYGVSYLFTKSTSVRSHIGKM